MRKPAAKKSARRSRPARPSRAAPARGAAARAKPAAKKPAKKPARKPARSRGAAPAVPPAAPAQAAPAPVAAPPDTSRPRAEAIARAGLDKKAEDVVLLDVRGLTSYADYCVIMTADSERQADAIADAVEEQLKALGAQKVGSEGTGGGRWVLIDYGDVVAHVFSREARSFYDLEGLWADAPRVAVQG